MPLCLWIAGGCHWYSRIKRQGRRSLHHLAKLRLRELHDALKKAMVDQQTHRSVPIAQDLMPGFGSISRVFSSRSATGCCQCLLSYSPLLICPYCHTAYPQPTSAKGHIWGTRSSGSRSPLFCLAAIWHSSTKRRSLLATLRHAAPTDNAGSPGTMDVGCHCH